jgi:hypothetical protein
MGNGGGGWRRGEGTGFADRGFGFIQSGADESATSGESRQAFGWQPGSKSGSSSAVSNEATAQPKESSIQQAVGMLEPATTIGGFVAAGSAMGAPGAAALASGSASASSGAVAGGLTALGAGMLVIGPIVGSIAGKAFGPKKPRGAFRSSPLGDRGNYEDGVIYTSKLGNMGMSNAETKHVNAGEMSSVFEGMVGIDNTLYEYFDETARNAIKDGFRWEVPMQIGKGILRDRYGKMLDHAVASGSEGAKNAKQTLTDAQADYKIAFQSINGHVDQGKRSARQAAEAEAIEATTNPTYDEGISGGGYQPGNALAGLLRDGSSGSQEEQAAASSAVAAAAYEDYKKAGGKMSQEMFSNTFKKNINQAARGEAYGDDTKQTRSPEMEALMQSAGMNDEKYKTYGKMGEEDYFALMIGGLQGYSYEDIVGGAAAQGTTVQEQEAAAAETSNAANESYNSGRVGFRGKFGGMSGLSRLSGSW